MASRDPLRHLAQHEHLHGAFGNDAFGRVAERGARFFGTPQYVVGQSAVVVVQLHAESSARHAQELAERQEKLLEENTRLTEESHRLSAAIHARVVEPP